MTLYLGSVIFMSFRLSDCQTAMLAQTTRSFHCMAVSIAAACTICAFAMQAPRQLADLPPALAAAMRDARAEAERLAAELPDAAARGDAWGNLGMLYHAHRLRYLAQDAYQRAVAEAQGSRWRYLHGIALSELGEIERAAADFRFVTRMTPDSMPAWYRLGVALLLTGDLAGAQSALEKALALGEKSALVLAALADVATARADHRAALALLTQAWELEPEAGQLAYKLAMAHRAVGDSAAASAWLARQPDNSFAPKIDDPLLLEVAQMSRSARFYEIAADWALGRGDLEAAINALRSRVRIGPRRCWRRLAFGDGTWRCRSPRRSRSRSSPCASRRPGLCARLASVGVAAAKVRNRCGSASRRRSYC